MNGTAAPLPPTGTNPIDASDLMDQLARGWARLPNRTVLALAWSGLRVRLMRSMVTTLSVVFAIAFLSYTGLTNHMTRNLALELRRLETLRPPDLKADPARAAAAIGALDLFSDMPLAGRRDAARMLRLHEIDTQAATLIEVQDEQLDNTAQMKDAATALESLRNDDSATPQDVSGAEDQVKTLEAVQATLKQRQAKLKAQIELGQWVLSNDTDDALANRLTEALRAEHQRLFAAFVEAGGLDQTQLHDVRRLIDLAQAKAGAQDVQTLRAVLATERSKIDATELRARMRRHGLNVDITLAGNPLDTWLIVMALLTCTVGIANAMLMSVTERFREIGTMKCLGALDSLVVKLFLLESALLGVVGAMIGIALGIAVALLAAVGQFGGFGMQQFPVLQAAPVVGYSVLCGIVLAVSGAVYPAFAASRMKPVDALRVDE